MARLSRMQGKPAWDLNEAHGKQPPVFSACVHMHDAALHSSKLDTVAEPLFSKRSDVKLVGGDAHRLTTTATVPLLSKEKGKAWSQASGCARSQSK